MKKFSANNDLDVLMVWHSFMLNPRSYLEDCLRFGLKNLWTTGMPWQAVNASITTQFNYEVPEAEAKNAWVTANGTRMGQSRRCQRGESEMS